MADGMRCLQCLIRDDKILSPGVGTFLSDNHAGSVGILKRLHLSWSLSLPPDCTCMNIVVPNGAFVMFGDVIGDLNVSSKNVQTADALKLYAPLDGFISFDDGTGNPLKKQGDILHSGEIVAILELMKIRMEITFDGADGCKFIGYSCSNHAAIRRGEPILAYSYPLSYLYSKRYK